MRSLTLDAKTKGFSAKKAQERKYARKLKKVARQVGNITESYRDGSYLNDGYEEAMAFYTQGLFPWAQKVAREMVTSVDLSNIAAWSAMSKKLGASMRKDPVLPKVMSLMNEQIELILSLPTVAAQRAQKLSLEAALDGARADEIAKEIARTGEVTSSRALLIARTETARASNQLTEARAVSVGSEAYIWRTSEDSDVRESHKEMDGKVCYWASPPTLSDGTTTNAGGIYNCRCYPEPIFSDAV